MRTWIAATVLIACACASIASAQAKPPLAGTKWMLETLGDRAVAASASGRDPYLQFDTDAGRVTGSTGCNRLTGPFTIDGAKLTVGQLAVTRMACVDGPPIEQRFLAALGKVAGWRIEGQHLAVLDASGGVLARLKPAPAAPRVRTAGGTLEGTLSADGRTRIFKGIPYAAPPTGERRWKAPEPLPAWQGVRKATAFGPRCMQGAIYSDMIFRDDVGEDCLVLNVWTPARDDGERLPVMVWIHGGGFQAGSGSEPRQDGERLAAKGVVVASLNYRLGVFGFMAHPELTKESGRNASGNYGLLDQVAALEWVKANIAAFGGDPANVTVFGESAGSFSVSALMASPLAKGLFHKAIGQSGAILARTLAPPPLPQAEKLGADFAASIGASTLAALRAKPADEILQAALKVQGLRFIPGIDGHVLPREGVAIYADGQQHKVPLLAGWNADEVRSGVVLAKEPPTAKSFAEQARKQFGERADALLKVYPASTDAEALESAASLAGDMFVGFSTWKWLELHARTGGVPTYRYLFDRKIPIAPDTMVNGKKATAADIGARHAGEIEYVFGALDSVPKVTWEPVDRTISDLMMTYWSNFAKTGDPNGPGLPQWPRYSESKQVMRIGTQPGAALDPHRARYEALDAISK